MAAFMGQGSRVAGLLPLLLCLFLVGCQGKRAAKEESAEVYIADLRGDSMVPPVNTTGHGQADFTFHHFKKGSNSRVSYNITLFEVSGVKSVELHQAQMGQPGDLAAYLFSPIDNPPPKTVNGLLKAGNLTHTDLKGPFGKKADTNDLEQRAKDSDIYVLVTTAAHPDGELRGQVKKSA